MKAAEHATLPCVVIEPSGILDVAELVLLKNTIVSYMRHGRFHVVVNLRRVKHLNYIGLTVLAESAAKLRDFGGDVFLTGCGPYLAMIFQSVGLDRHFRFYPSNREALAAVREQARFQGRG